MTDVADNAGYTPEQELEALKMRADRLGLSYHPSIGVEKLREKLAAHMAALNAQNLDQAEQVEPPAPPGKTLSENARRRAIMDKALKLVRIRVTCMNPFKKEWEGEIFTVGNSVIGSVKKYVPFNNDAGWHVPQIMLNMLQERQCQIFYNEKTKNGVPIRRGKLIKEFAIEILPPLTEKELHDLKQQQAMANRV